MTKRTITTISGKIFTPATNQRIMAIHKNKIKKNEQKVIFSSDSYWTAKRNTTEAAHTLWVYLLENADTQGRFAWALSRSNFVKTTGMHSKSYQRGFDELMNKGYIVNCGNDNYSIYESPVPEEQVTPAPFRNMNEF